MLVLSRKVGQELIIGDNIRIVVSRVAGNRVSLAIDAPNDVHVIRAELQEIREEFSAPTPPAARESLRSRVASRRAQPDTVGNYPSLQMNEEYAAAHVASR